MTDFSHPLDRLEIDERRALAQEFADARDQLALSRGLEPHQKTPGESECHPSTKSS